MFPLSRSIDRYETTFDHDGLIASAGLIVVATLMSRLGMEGLANTWVRTGVANPGRKLCTLIAAMAAGATHIEHVDMLRAGATQQVLPFRVMAPSAIETCLRSFTFGFVRQLDVVASRLFANAWAVGAGPGTGDLVIDLDSTICEVHGHTKRGAEYGYAGCLGYHPLIATRAGTGEILFSQMRKGSAESSLGINPFINELAGVWKRAKATGTKCVRADSGFWSWELLHTLRFPSRWPWQHHFTPSSPTCGPCPNHPANTRPRGQTRRTTSPVSPTRQIPPHPAPTRPNSDPHPPSPSNTTTGITTRHLRSERWIQA